MREYPEMHRFAAQVEARRAPPVPRWAAPPRSRGEAARAWAEARTRPPGAEPAWAAPPGASRLPRRLQADMGRCQKPFHLWNVERPVLRHAFALVREEPLRLGRVPARASPVAALGPWRRPLEEAGAAPAGRVLGEARELRRLLAAPLPFGRPG